MISNAAETREKALQAIGASVGVDGFTVGSDWDVTAVIDGGEVIGGIISKGDEAHIGLVRPTFIRHAIRKFIKPGCVTKVRESHLAGQEFVKRLGFVETDRIDGVVMYEMKGPKHV